MNRPVLHPGKKIQYGILAALAIAALAFINTDTFAQVSPVGQPHSVINVNPGSFYPVSQAAEYSTESAIPASASGNNKGSLQPSPLALPPPGNDDCAAGLNPPYVLSPNASCTNGTLQMATTQAGEVFGCFAPVPTRTVWYSFTATQTNMWVSINPTGAIVCSQNFGLAVYRYSGTCPPAGVGGCKNYQGYSAQYVYNNLGLTGLTIGATYLIQVTQNPGCTRYTFCIKVGTYLNCTTCASPCGPICTFAGPTQPTPTQVVTTCPGYPLGPPMNQFDIQTNCYTFTAPNDTVNMQQVVYAYCSPNTYSFTYSLYTAGCGLIQSGNVFSNNMITGLVPGTNYRICYTLQSACSWDSLIYPYLYTTSSVLPVELVRFEAESQKKRVLVRWTTASEINNKEYILERTRNAMDFTEVARIEGAGNSTTLLEYEVADLDPYNGMNFYRLRQVDFNGDEHTTKLVSARFDKAGASVTIAPNPATDMCMVSYYAEKNSSSTIRMSDLNGHVVIHKLLRHDEAGMQQYALDVSSLPRGMYFVQVVSSDESVAAKLVRQ